MPTLFRFLLVVGLLGGLIYAGAFWLAAAVTIFGALWWAFGLPEIRQVELD